MTTGFLCFVKIISWLTGSSLKTLTTSSTTFFLEFLFSSGFCLRTNYLSFICLVDFRAVKLLSSISFVITLLTFSCFAILAARKNNVCVLKYGSDFLEFPCFLKMVGILSQYSTMASIFCIKRKEIGSPATVVMPFEEKKMICLRSV
jgi:hypothetical protein